MLILAPPQLRTSDPNMAPPLDDIVAPAIKKNHSVEPVPWHAIKNEAQVNPESNETVAVNDGMTNMAKTESSVSLTQQDHVVNDTEKEKTNTTIDHISATTNNTTDITENATIMAFIRIPKTGSTSLLNFLMTDSQNLNSQISNQFWNSMGYRQQSMYTCLFYNSHVMNTTVHPPRKPQCAHANHGGLHEAFDESKQYFNMSLPSLKTFTMVREPFDRLRSFFYYMRLSVNDTQWAKNANTKRMYEQVVNGNFSKWLELLWSEYNVLDMQYEYLSRNATTAIEMFENGTVDVYVNECFDTSLRFMAQRYHMGPVENFLQNSTVVRSNTNQKKYVNLFRQEQLLELRANAKAWFTDEYRFYNAAVRHFQRQLTSSSMPLECRIEI